MNTVLLVGNLGRDAEVKSIQSGKMATVSVATKNGEQTEWHRVVLFGDIVDRLQPALVKGARVFVEGRLSTRSYEKDGQKHYATDVIARNVIVSSIPSSSSPPSSEDVPF